LDKKALGAIIAASAIIIGFAVLGIYTDNIVIFLYAINNNRDIPSSAEVSDGELVNRTKDLREVTAFLTKYPNPVIYVDRLDHFSVDYQVTEAEHTGRPYNGTSSVQPYTSLKVRLSDEGYL
jgi:hypothetical protein